MRERLDDGPVYVSVDIDVIDPGCGARAPAHRRRAGSRRASCWPRCVALAGLDLVSADIVEVAPAYDHAEITGIAAAHVAYELLGVMSRPEGGAMASDTSSPARIAGVEVRSIDYVPLNERHGKVWRQGPLWFMSNAQIATLAVGTFSVVGGGNLIWSLIAIVAGALIGTFFMAAHSAQGPQLGLPQMIQSRPQFGYVGAILVWLFAYLQYAGFNVFNTILAADSLHTTVHGSSKLWIIVATVVAAVVALVGYDLIHRVERWLAYGFLVLFGILDHRDVHAALPGRLLRPRRVQAGRRSWSSSVRWRATRSAGRSTSRTTRATSRPT